MRVIGLCCAVLYGQISGHDHRLVPRWEPPRHARCGRLPVSSESVLALTAASRPVAMGVGVEDWPPAVDAGVEIRKLHGDAERNVSPVTLVNARVLAYQGKPPGRW